MKRRHVARMMAVVTAVGLTVTTPVTVMAETRSNAAKEPAAAAENPGKEKDSNDAGETKTVVECVVVSGSETKTIDGDVAVSDGGDAICMVDDYDVVTQSTTLLDGSVTVTGDVSVDDKNEGAESYSTGVYIGSEGGKGVVTVGGDITAFSASGIAQGIDANGNGSEINTHIDIEVGGDINATSDGDAAGGIRIGSGEAGEITVNGDIKASGAQTNENNSVNSGILINSNKSGKTESLTIDVDGDVTAEGYHGRGVYSNDEGRNLDIKIGGDVSGSQYGVTGNGNGGETHITIGGDVSGGDAAAKWSNKGGEMHIAIDGDVSGSQYGILGESNEGETHITVGGNVSGEEAGVNSSTNNGGEVHITIDGDVSGSQDGILGNSNGGKTSITVGGEVKSSGDIGIWIGGSNMDTDLTVGKGITVSDESDKSSVVGLGIKDNGTNDTDTSHIDAQINGDIAVTSKEHRAVGIELSGAVEGDITVSGDIKAKGDDKPDENNSGRSEAFGINFAKTETGSEQPITITIGGDVLAEGNNACAVYGENFGGTAVLSVDGDISGSRWGVGLSGDGNVDVATTGTISHQGNADGSSIWLSIKESTDDVPSITAWKIEGADDDTMVDVAYKGDTVSEEKQASIVAEYTEKVRSAINYIIKGSVTENGKETDIGTLVLTGVSGKVTVGDKTYDTAHQGEKIKISVKTVAGYKYSISNGQELLKRNSGGTYTLIVPEGGGVDLRAVIEKIEQDRSDDDSDSGSGGSSGSGSSSGSGGSSGSSSSSVSDSTGTAARNAKGPGIVANAEGSWTTADGLSRFTYANGTYAAGSRVLDSNGIEREHLGWVRINDGWHAFGSDAVQRTGWVKDELENQWYYCDAQKGMSTGWMLSSENGCWYYLDPATGHMLTGWQTIDGKLYYLGTDQGSEAHSYGALYVNTATPDGYMVNEDGARL